MLILQRSNQEIINIGDDIVIQVLKLNEYCVSLGITAPDHIKVWRNEVYRAIQEGVEKPERKMGSVYGIRRK